MCEESTVTESCTSEDMIFQRGSDGRWQNTCILLEEHPFARNQALAKRSLSPGATIITDSALSFVLLPEEKGSRCDACLQRSQNTLKRCSGCAEYWYCGSDCQARHWQLNHKPICKHLAKFRASKEFQVCPSHRKLDSILLSHLASEHSEVLTKNDLPREDLRDPLATLASLIPLPTEEHPPICTDRKTGTVSSDVLNTFYSRFSNNNFIIHSHLTPIGHGIFPKASRLFNHSCVPNAIITYTFGSEGVCMLVKALTKIQSNEEITIPYFDPALPFQRRQEICRFSYGFECTCPNCKFCKSTGPLFKPPIDPVQRSNLEQSLVRHAFPDLNPAWPSKILLYDLPSRLKVILHEDFLPNLSTMFRNAAHDGPYEDALRSGAVLLSLYVILYPPFYPQTGVHCLEMAKTAWNASVQGSKNVGEEGLLASARHLLVMATDALSVLGREGDKDDGPLMEAAILNELLETS